MNDLANTGHDGHTMMTWIFNAGKCTTSSFLVWYVNKQVNGMRKGAGMKMHTLFCLKIQVIQ